MEDNARRVISGLGATTLVIGSMVGIGIFLAPPVVAAHVPSSTAFLGVWLAGGLTALAGAVALAELGAMLPHAGGDYVFVREAFGPSVAFASGWVLFGPVFAGSIAAIASALCHYQLPVVLQAGLRFVGVDATIDLMAPLPGLPFALPMARVAAAALVIGITLANVRGARLSTGLQGVLTGIAVFSLAALAVWGLHAGGAPTAGVGVPAIASGQSVSPTLSGFVRAYLPVYFAYSGWNAVVYVAGEVREPGRVLPRALFTGTGVVAALYLLLCSAFLAVFGLEGLRQVGEAGSTLAERLGGLPLRVAIAGVLIAALLGALNGAVLGGARVAYAMARSGAFWGFAGKLNAREAPAWALWVQAAIAATLVLTGTFEQVLGLASLAMQLTGSLAVASLFVLRRKAPHLERPFLATGYPWLPALYLLASVIVMTSVAVDALQPGSVGARYPFVGLLAFGVAWLLHRVWPALRGEAG